MAYHTKTEIVGILNLTPDSFSDGGKYSRPKRALEHVASMIEEGAKVVDVGAQSTRPGAELITPEEEWSRLKDVLPYLKAAHPDTIFSIDTMHAATAKRALESGIDWVNDVSGFADPAMVEAVKDTDCKLVIMHSLTVPPDPEVTLATDKPVANQLIAWVQEKAKLLKEAGIGKERMIFDPGVGFGKTAEQSLEIIQTIDTLKTLGLPLYIGHSRKSFLSLLAEKQDEDRDIQTLVVSHFLMKHDVEYIRVHDVKMNVHLRANIGTVTTSPLDTEFKGL